MTNSRDFEVNTTCLEHPIPAEELIVGCLQAIREAFAVIDDTPTGNYCDRWSTALLGERPIIVVSLLDKCEAKTWVMDAQGSEVVHASCQGTIVPPVGFANWEPITLPLAKIREMVGWLRYGQTACWLQDETKYWLPPEQREEKQRSRTSGAEDAASAA